MSKPSFDFAPYPFIRSKLITISITDICHGNKRNFKVITQGVTRVNYRNRRNSCPYPSLWQFKRYLILNAFYRSIGELLIM